VMTLPHAGHLAFLPAFSEFVVNILPQSQCTLIMAGPQ
jgi:hypothetical protein